MECLPPLPSSQHMFERPTDCVLFLGFNCFLLRSGKRNDDSHCDNFSVFSYIEKEISNAMIILEFKIMEKIIIKNALLGLHYTPDHSSHGSFEPPIGQGLI